MEDGVMLLDLYKTSLPLCYMIFGVRERLGNQLLSTSSSRHLCEQTFFHAAE